MALLTGAFMWLVSPLGPSVELPRWVRIVSVGTIIGVQQLGLLFSDGFNRDFYDPLVVGIIGCVVLALLFDGIIILLARLLTPWQRATGGRA